MKQQSDRRCVQCGHPMTSRRENYRYTASGLPGVILENILVHRCASCGDAEYEIPDISGLHERLARSVVGKKERLSPAEIRFLRTYLGYSTGDFARKVGVSVPTVSRWERVDEPLRMKPAVDRFIRLMVLAGDAVKGYPLEEMATLEPKARTLRMHATKSGWTETEASSAG